LGLGGNRNAITGCNGGESTPIRGAVGVKLIVVLLLANSLGYFAFGIYYLTVLLDPFSHIFSGIFLDPSLAYLWIGSGSWDAVFRAFLSMTIGRNLVFQGLLLVSQILFLAALGALLVFVAWGLLRMRSWARRATMLYAALYPVFIIVYFLTLWFAGNCVFNINLLTLLYHFISFDNSIPLLHKNLVMILMFVASAFFVLVPIYLNGNVKHKFK